MTIEEFYSALGELPAVQFRVVFLSVLDVLTILWAIVLSFVTHESHGAVPVFENWLFLLGGLHGANLGGYAAKRFSDNDYAAAKTSGINPNTNRDPDAPLAPPPPPFKEAA